MRLLFDARVIQPHFPGIGRYARTLLQALVEVDPALELELLTEPKAERLPFPRARWHSVPPVFSPTSQLAIPWLARRLKAVLFHAPYYLSPFAVPLPTVVTIHDLIPLDYPNMLSSSWAQRLYKPLHCLAAWRAAAVITDSEATRASVQRHLRVAPERVVTIPLAADPFFQPHLGIARERFFFARLSWKPHKNSARLVRAYAATDPARHGVPLHVAGLREEEWPAFAEMAGVADLRAWVRPLGHLSDEALRDQYRRCLAFLFPSFIEGFGLPVSEAMACGAPVLIANRPPMTELADGAALTIDPFDEAALAGALLRLLNDAELRRALGTRGLARAHHFSWTDTARRTLAVYERVLAS